MGLKRYFVLFGALGAQLTIASLYAWSILNNAIFLEYGWDYDTVLATYAIAQFVFAFSTIFSGKLIDTKGPKINLFIGALLFGFGLILSSYATSPYHLYFSFGLLCGVGVGFVYVVPLTTLLKWFPTKKGLITGIAVSVFGGGSILFKELITYLLTKHSVSTTFIILGIVSMITILIGSFLIALPEKSQTKKIKKTKSDFTSKEMFQTLTFKKTWITFFLAVIPGMLLLGAAKDIGLSNNMSIKSAANLITILAISNAASRIIVGYLSDKFGILRMLRLTLISTVLSLFFISFFNSNLIVFYVSIIGIIFAYGGFLILFPAWVNDRFGIYRFGSNYGIVFQAYGLAALAGILIKALAGSYTNTFIVSSIAGVVALLISYTLSDEPLKNNEI